MDRLACMQVFVRVVEHGAFTRAADALGISRASASAAVAGLEKRLGVRLLQRTTRRLSVTDEGQSYYQHCVRILEQVAESEDCLAEARHGAHGRLRVSVPASFADRVFYPALAEFLERHPRLEVDVVFSDRAVNLVEEGIDCAIRGVEIAPDADLVVRPLSETRWLTCAAPSYLDQHGLPSAIDDLERHECIRFVSQSTGRPRDWLFCVEGEVRAVQPRGRLRLNAFDAVLGMARQGAGIAQVPDLLGYQSVMDGLLRPLFTQWVAPAPSLVLVYPGTRYLATRVRLFIDHFSEVFRTADLWPRIVRRAA